MEGNRLLINVVSLLLLLINSHFTVNLVAQTPIPTPNSKKIYHFPPPMDGPDFPFTVVTIDKSTPNWAKMIYDPNPNINIVRKLYHQWRQTNPTVKNGHTRNFRKLSGYLAYNNYVNQDGFIDIPTNEEIKATQNKILQDRAKFKRQNQNSKARNSNNTTWQLVGPTFMKETDGDLTDTQINIYSITQCLTNKDVLYCASESGGTVFKTTNHGDTWFSISDNLITSMGARNIEVAPSNEDIVYLCTRDDIFKTTTGSDNWVSVYDNYKSNNRTLIINPTNPNTVLAGGDNGILKSTDGGANWTNPLPAKAIYDLRYKPSDTLMIYALVKNDATNLTEFYKSTDGGDSWSIRTTGWPTESANSTNGGQMTTSDGNDNYIYAFIGSTWTSADNTRNIKILKSLDYGESWTTVVDYDNDFGINSGQGYYDWDIEMSDTNPDVVYGGTQGRWVTKDGFQTINQDIGSLGHADVQETLFNGTDLWVTNDGGIILFDDENFQNYTPKSKGINAISYWSFDQGWNKDVSSATHYHNGTSFMHENYETNVGINLGGAEPSFSLVAQPSGEKVVSKGYGSVNGYTVPDAQDGTYTRFNYNLTPNTHSYSGNNVGVHPLATETHFLGVENALLKSVNFGVTWDTLYKFPSTSDFIWDIELTRANTNAIFVSTIDGGGGSIYRSLDGGQSFVEITLPSQFSSTTKLNVSVSNEDENIFYVMGDRYGIKIAKTTDGGTTWIDLDTPTLHDYDGHKIMQVDGTDGGIYLLATRGVFYRNNTMTDWIALTDGMPANTYYNYIRPFYRDKALRIATSRGVYKAELYETPQLSDALLQPSAKRTTTDCARDTFYFDDYSVVEHAGATWSWSFPGATYVSATNVRNPRVVYGNAGQYDVTMSIMQGGQTYTKTVEKMIEVGNACTAVDEIAGKSLKLNRATNDRAVTNAFNVTTNTFTFSAWIKPTGSFQAFQGVFSNGVWCAHCNESTLGLIMNYWGDRLYYRWPGSTSGWSSASNLYPQLDEWSYVAMVVSPDKVTLYLNEEKWEQNISHDPATIQQLYLGFGHYTKYFNGEIEEATFWKRSLTDTEIKELMHLTKDPTTDPDLLAYYQFNEEEGDILDKAGFYKAQLLGNASRVTSSAPVGKGTSSTQTESAGTVAFATTDFEVNYANQSGIETVASKINNAPYNLNGLINGDTPLAEEYWTVHRFGSGDFLADLTFKTNADISAADAANPCQYALYKRGNRSDEDWAFVANATSADAGTDKITFAVEVEGWAQYLVVKSTNSIIRATSPVILKNTAIGATSTESSYMVAGANLTANLQITAPIGFEISTTSGSGFTNSLSLPPSNGKVAETTIYVRFSPTESRLYSDNITHISTGATNLLVEVRGNGIELDCFSGTALDLDGSSDYVNLGNPTELQITGDLTIQMWLKPSNFSDRRNPIGKAYGGEFTINQETNGEVRFYNGSSGGNSGSYQQTDSEQALTLNEWNHITLVRDVTSRTVTWYINGVQTNQRTGARTDIAVGGNNVYIGEGYVSGFAGLIDEVRIWNTPLSEQQIREKMHLTLKGNEAGLVAYYQFNEADGDAKDFINGLDGTLVNDATRSLATQPVGCGFSNTQASPSGAITFTNTDLTANLNAATTDNIVATKINLAPNDVAGIGASESAADQQYWVINRYGGADDMDANLTFTLDEGITASETASSLQLYGRDQTSDGDWTLISAATSIDAANNTATFNNVTSYRQYLITKAPFPKITVNKSSLAFGNVNTNTNSAEQTYTVAAIELTADLSITAPSGFEISTTSGSGFTTTLTLSPTDGDIVETTIYVRYLPTANGYQSGAISHTSINATMQQISVDGTGVSPEMEVQKDATILTSGNTIDFGNSAVNSSKSLSFTIKNTDLGTLELTNIPTITVSGTDASDFVITESPSDTSLTADESTTFKVAFTPSSSGAKSATISINNNDADENPYTLNFTGSGDPLPTITVGSLTDFGTHLVGSTSAEQSYMVSGNNLTDNVLLSSTAGFEISLTSGSGFRSEITLTPSNGTLANTTIYVRFIANSIYNYSGIITHSSNSAETKTIGVTGGTYQNADTIPDKAVQFNGSSDYLSMSADPVLDFGTSTDFTVALWMKTDNWQNDASIVSKKDWDSGSNKGWNLALATDGKGIDVNVGDGSNRADLQAGNLNDGEWHHIAATFDRDGAVSLYVDGILEQSTSMAHVGDIDNTLLLTFGRDSENEYFFDGMIDEAKIWNTALTIEQIREAMHITANLNSPNLIAYYQFNETSHIAVNNLKGTAHGSLIGGDRPVSTAPIGGGFTNTQRESSGTISFTNTDVDINFTAQNSAEVVVSKINLAPNTIPTGLPRVFNSQYWAIHRYGSGSFAGNITFKVAADLTDADQEMPDDILLYGRNFNSDTDWTLVTAATSVDAANDKATFDAITNFDQFLIVSSSDGLAEPADCLPDMVYENKNDLPNINSSTTYIKAGNINGSGDVVIENGQNILFRAKEYIQLVPGFSVKAGAEFTAKIEDCGAGIVEDAPEEQVATARTSPKIEQPEVKTALDMNVYPNPFETRFFVDYRINNEAQVTIQLFDLQGRKVRDILMDKRRKPGTYKARFTNRNLTVGTYILVIQVDEEVHQRKVVMSGR